MSTFDCSTLADARETAYTGSVKSPTMRERLVAWAKRIGHVVAKGAAWVWDNRDEIIALVARILDVLLSYRACMA